MQIAIRHQLSLGLGAGLARSAQHLLLTPQSGATQTVREWKIELAGMAEAARFIDCYGNVAHLVTQTKPEAELVLTVAGVVETVDRNGVVGRSPGEPMPALFRRPTPAAKPIGAITQRFRATPKSGQDRIALLHALMARVGEVLGGPSDEPSQSQSQSQSGQSQSQSQGGAPAVTALASATEHAHAFIGAARALEIPARFVSGYLAEAEDIPAAHAWAEAWDDGLGWIGFDPLLGYCPTDRHVRVASGLDGPSAIPVRAVPVIGEPQVLTLSVEVG